MNDNRERDALIAEQLMGWQRFRSALIPSAGYILMLPDALMPEHFVPASQKVERAADFWYLMDERIPKYSEEASLSWRLIQRIVPEERPMPHPNTGSMIVHPIPFERWHAVRMWTVTSTIFMDWHVEIRALDENKPITSASGPNLPHIVAVAMADLIRIERWKNGQRGDGCKPCQQDYGFATKCRHPNVLHNTGGSDDATV